MNYLENESVVWDISSERLSTEQDGKFDGDTDLVDELKNIGSIKTILSLGCGHGRMENG